MRIDFVPLLAPCMLLGAAVAPARIDVPGDFEDLATAIRVARDGETIHLAAGVHALPATDASERVGGKSLAFVGDGFAGEVTLTAESGALAALLEDAAFASFDNLNIVGGVGGQGYPPHQCAGGTGETGGGAIWLESVRLVTIRNCTLQGGQGGFGLPNTGGCPAPGVTGIGGPGVFLVNCRKVIIENSTIFGGCGGPAGDSVWAWGGTHIHGSGVSLPMGCTGTGTGGVVELDSSSTFDATVTTRSAGSDAGEPAATSRASRASDGGARTQTTSFAGWTTPGTTSYPNDGMAEDSAAADDDVAAAAAGSGYIFLATDSDPARVSKVDASTLQAVGGQLLSPGESYVETIVRDSTGGSAYLGTYTAPGRVVKVSEATATRTAAITLQAGESFLRGGVVAPDGTSVFFGTDTSPASIVRIGTAPFARTGALTLGAGEDYISSGVSDPGTGMAYFGTDTEPARIVKVDLASFTEVGVLMLDAGEDRARTALISPAGDFAYFACWTSPGSIVKVDLGSFTRSAAVTLDAGEAYPGAGFVVPAQNLACFGTYTSPAYAVKLDLTTFTRNGALTFLSGEDRIYAGGFDPVTSAPLFATVSSPGEVLRLDFNHPGMDGQLVGVPFTIPAKAEVDSVHFYSHAASGNTRLAIYSDQEPKYRRWESGVVPVTVADGELVVPVSSGAPTRLFLQPGNYWATWQVDSTDAVPSYTPGTAGSSFILPQAFGPAPASIPSASITPTSAHWTEYVSYTVDTTPPVCDFLANDATVAGGSVGGTLAATDGTGVGVDTTYLWFDGPPAHQWTLVGPISGGTWSFTPAGGDGDYFFAIRALDYLGNATPWSGGVPRDSITVTYNNQANSSFYRQVWGSTNWVFPMTNAIDEYITLGGTNPYANLAMSRLVGNYRPQGFDSAKLIDEALVLGEAGYQGSVFLTWNYDAATAAGLVGTIDSVFRESGGSVVSVYPVTHVGSAIFIGPIVPSGTFYAGSSTAGTAASAAPSWMEMP